jgi:molybdopterin molybdotransferase
MIDFEIALDIVLNSTIELKTEEVTLDKSIGKILAKDIHSDIEMPPFNKSAMDGFACKRDDTDIVLEIIETIPAGYAPQNKVGKNQCSRIMTGGMVPEGADCVIRVEDTEMVDKNSVQILTTMKNNNIAYQGEDVKVGQKVLDKGIIIKPQTIAVLASVGCAEITVSKMPIVGVISTGSELVEPNQKPGLSQIRNSNSYQLVGQISKLNCISKYYGIAEDTEEATFKIITKALSECDVVLLTGGVSMGDFDFVPKVFEKIGVDIKFEQLAVQPGKPTTFGLYKNKRIFGLPGNPVSSYVQFELLVKPLLYQMMGHEYKQENIFMPLGVEYKRRNTTRRSWIPVQLNDNGEVIPVSYHGSAHIHSLAFADGLINIGIGKELIEKGEVVDVRLI